MEELTLEKFEEAFEAVQKVTLETKLVYSEYFSNQTGNKIYFKPENLQYTGCLLYTSQMSVRISIAFIQNINKNCAIALAGHRAAILFNRNLEMRY